MQAKFVGLHLFAGKSTFIALHPVGAEPRPYKLPRKKVISIWISTAPSIDDSHSTATSCKLDSHVSGGAYQDAREVTSEWNDA